ncbi:Kelch repeat-containing protein [Amycolatopsis vastitatis]|uniref:Kelch-like protein 17 n=1 Tax=Amycolatopsis vastitatis TaxID=1905142 RepID=A0A229TEU8_9PSEU|nr:kelch repeat-containing protein [Amycolatopsis vastitatis]OXM69767.1 Kelch-like protein 17 [Amycolatopsis vastitatis]
MTSSTLAATGTWKPGKDLPAPGGWYGQHDGAVVLTTPDGKSQVLVVGGVDGKGVAQATGAVYDVAGDAWTTADPHVPRRLHATTVLADGKVLVTGGVSGSPFSPGLTAAEIFNPADKTWKVVAGMKQGRWGHSAVLLPNKQVLVAGGATNRSGDSIRALASAELYDPDKNTWTDAKPMTDPRTGHTAIVLKDGKVLVCGGTVPVSGTGDVALGFCELYTPGTTPGNDSWSATGSLLRPRTGHQAVKLSETSVLVVGGGVPGAPGDGTFDPYARLTVEQFDLTAGAGTWQDVTPAEPVPRGRGLHRAVPLGTGKVLVAGGTAGPRDDVGYPSALILDASGAEKTWTTAAGMATGRWAFAAVALPGTKVLVTGGVARSGLAATDPDADELAKTTEIFDAGSGS